jgi:hypothetical protein
MAGRMKPSRKHGPFDPRFSKIRKKVGAPGTQTLNAPIRFSIARRTM